MSMKDKSFDCVEMKLAAQQRLHVEYELRKVEFSSYFAFVEAKANESSQQQDFWANVAAAKKESVQL